MEKNSKLTYRHRPMDNVRLTMEGNSRPAYDRKMFSKLRSDEFLAIPSEYNHRIFKKAGLLFDALSSKGNNILVQQATKNIKIKFRNEEERRKTLELTQSALPYQRVLEKVLNKTNFFKSNRSFEKEKGIVMVMLHDYLQRHFQPVPPSTEKETQAVTSQISEALYLKKTAINAELARERIAQNARSVEELIPSMGRRCVDILPSLPQYAWVNHFKTNLPALLKQLAKEGFVHVVSPKDLCSLAFCEDVDCSDLLVFHPDCRFKLLRFCLVEMNHLIIQHKSSCLGAYLMASLVFESHVESFVVDKRPQVLITHLGEGWTAAHLASLVGNRAVILACASQSDSVQVEQRIGQLGTYNIKVIHHSFLNCSPDDPAFSQVVAILVTPRCSNSGISDPVDFILREGGDVQLLREVVGLSVQQKDDINTFQEEQKKILRHALRFRYAHHVVYNTHSVDKRENDEVVEWVLERVNEEYREEQKNLHNDDLIKMEIPPDDLFRVEAPDMYQRLLNDQSAPSKYLQIIPNQWMEGCFLAVIKRQTIFKVPAKDILYQAKTKGILAELEQKRDAACRLNKKIQTDVFCGRCDRRGIRAGRRARNNSQPPFKVGGSLHHGTFPAAPRTAPTPKIAPHTLLQPIWKPTHGPFPVFKNKSSRKRRPYPLATKTLHLPGVAPPAYYRTVLNFNQNDAEFIISE